MDNKGSGRGLSTELMCHFAYERDASRRSGCRMMPLSRTVRSVSRSEDLSPLDVNILSPHSTTSGAPMSLGGDDLRLLCVIEGETEAFLIDVEGASWHNPRYMVGDLKKRIQEERKDGSLSGVDPHSLVLWKVRAIDES